MINKFVNSLRREFPVTTWEKKRQAQIDAVLSGVPTYQNSDEFRLLPQATELAPTTDPLAALRKIQSAKNADANKEDQKRKQISRMPTQSVPTPNLVVSTLRMATPAYHLAGSTIFKFIHEHQGQYPMAVVVASERLEEIKQEFEAMHREYRSVYNLGIGHNRTEDINIIPSSQFPIWMLQKAQISEFTPDLAVAILF